MVGDGAVAGLDQPGGSDVTAAGTTRSRRCAAGARPVTWSTRATNWPMSATAIVTGCQNTVDSG